MRLYKEKWGFPLCAGAIDGTHIPMQAPLENRTDYINRKSYHSIVVMQALVDSKSWKIKLLFGRLVTVDNKARIV